MGPTRVTPEQRAGQVIGCFLIVLGAVLSFAIFAAALALLRVALG